MAREVGVETLRPGDRLRLAAGERLATDGVVVTGHSSLDTSAITGESVPVEAGPGSEVFAGSINGTGALTVHPRGGRKVTFTELPVEVAEAMARRIEAGMAAHGAGPTTF